MDRNSGFPSRQPGPCALAPRPLWRALGRNVPATMTKITGGEKRNRLPAPAPSAGQPNPPHPEEFGTAAFDPHVEPQARALRRLDDGRGRMDRIQLQLR